MLFREKVRSPDDLADSAARHDLMGISIRKAWAVVGQTSEAGGAWCACATRRASAGSEIVFRMVLIQFSKNRRRCCSIYKFEKYWPNPGPCAYGATQFHGFGERRISGSKGMVTFPVGELAVTDWKYDAGKIRFTSLGDQPWKV